MAASGQKADVGGKAQERTSRRSAMGGEPTFGSRRCSPHDFVFEVRAVWTDEHVSTAIQRGLARHAYAKYIPGNAIQAIYINYPEAPVLTVLGEGFGPAIGEP